VTWKIPGLPKVDPNPSTILDSIVRLADVTKPHILALNIFLVQLA